MWRTEDGDRVLTEAEWKLFATGLDLLLDWVDSDITSGVSDIAQVGMKAFDLLTPEQKYAALADVSLALRDESTPAPFQTAANEAAIAAVFDCVLSMIETEIEAQLDGLSEFGISVRQRVLDAIGNDPDREDELPLPDCTENADWRFLLQEIESRVLWDYDFAMGDELLDLPPEQSRAILERLTIDPDYYLATPRDPNRQELVQARKTLAKLMGHATPEN